MNKSFEDVHNYLAKCGVKNNDFMLHTYDRGLIGLDPYDPNLTIVQKQAIISECRINIFYFFREVLRLPECGGGTVPFKLDLSNCPQIFLSRFNISTFVNRPRQLGNTISTCALILYYSLFHDSSVYYESKHMDDEIYNKIMSIHDILPEYMQLLRKDIIRTISEHTANICYFDEAEYLTRLEYFSDNDRKKLLSHMKACREMNRYSFYLFTSTVNDNSIVFDNLVNNRKALYWCDTYYDDFLYYSPSYRTNHVYFVYIKNSYKELGKDEEWLNRMRIMLNNNEDVIRREVLMIRKRPEDKNIEDNCNTVSKCYSFNEVANNLIDGKKVTNTKWNGRYYLKVHNDKKIYKYTTTGEIELYSPTITELQESFWYNLEDIEDHPEEQKEEEPTPYNFHLELQRDEKGFYLPPTEGFDKLRVVPETDPITGITEVKLEEEKLKQVKTFGFNKAMKYISRGIKISRVAWHGIAYIDLSLAGNGEFGICINKPGAKIDKPGYYFTKKDIYATDWYIYDDK